MHITSLAYFIKYRTCTYDFDKKVNNKTKILSIKERV